MEVISHGGSRLVGVGGISASFVFEAVGHC